MSAERICAKSGLLVDGDTRLSTDPCEYYHPSIQVHVGCGRLRCSSCKAWVRSGPPGLGLKEDERPDLRALHAASDWSALSFIEEAYTLTNRMRLYTCTCRYWAAERVEPIQNDQEFDSDPNVPWACAGHPQPELPLTLNDLTIDAGTNWAKLVDKILSGSCPRDLERKEAIGAEPALWLSWLYLYLHGLSVADALSAAIAERVNDSDPQVIGRVLYFFMQFPRARGIENVVAQAEADVHRVALGYPIPENISALTLWAVLVARLGYASEPREAVDARIDALVKRLLLVPRASLSHDDLGPTGTVEFERQRRTKLGWSTDTVNWFLQDFGTSRQSERTDVIGNGLARSSAIFAAPGMRSFIADHIVEIDAATPGRWRHAMTLLSDYRNKPDQGHLIVIAAARVIQAGLATPAEFRAWLEERRTSGWDDPAWVLPLESMLEEKN